MAGRNDYKGKYVVGEYNITGKKDVTGGQNATNSKTISKNSEVTVVGSKIWQGNVYYRLSDGYYVLASSIKKVSSGSTSNPGKPNTGYDNPTAEKLQNISNGNLRLSRDKNPSSAIVGIIGANDKVTKIGSPVVENGITRQQIRTASGQSGWITISDNSKPPQQQGSVAKPNVTNTTEKVSKTTTNSEKAPDPTDGVTSATDTPVETEEDVSGGYQFDVNDAFLWAGPATDFDNSVFGDISNVIGVFGLPYQFLPDTDMRLDGSDSPNAVGSVWADKIVKNIPIVFLAPGRANFMTAYNKEDAAKIVMKLGNIGGSMEDILQGKNGRYYTFEYANQEYYRYVNPACRLAAIMYGIGDETIPGESRMGMRSKLSNIDWSDYTRSKTGFFNINTNFLSVPFYIDSDSNISESFSNTTGDSTLANTVNGISDMARELNFVLGYGSAALEKNINSDETIKGMISGVQNTITNLFHSRGNVVNNLLSHLGTVASGGKLMFPQIWNDSSFSKSYDIKIKLASPNCNKVSIFFNIVAPLIHLICLAAPQSLDENPNSYHAPFLVRAIYKGMFNVDMGIITSMSINKGGTGMWTPDGVPTQVEVDLTIKDLYDTALTITPGDNLKYNTTTNTLLMDYLANLTGVNIYEPEISRQMAYYSSMMSNAPLDAIEGIWRKCQQGIANGISRLYRGY